MLSRLTSLHCCTLSKLLSYRSFHNQFLVSRSGPCLHFKVNIRFSFPSGNAMDVSEKTVRSALLHNGPAHPNSCALTFDPFTVNMKTFDKNRQRLVERLKSVKGNSFVLLKGGEEIPHYNTDTEHLFRQEPYFLWSFGVQEPNYWGGIDVKTGKSYLFTPRFPESYAVWMGELPSTVNSQKKYEVNVSLYVDQIEEVLQEVKPSEILLLRGVNSDSNLEMLPPTVPVKNNNSYKTDDETLYPVMSELRVIKTNYEIDILKRANRISSLAHRLVMKKIGACRNQYQAEALFKFYCHYIGGCRAIAYNCICGTGPTCAVLHYGHAAAPNLHHINETDMCLFDMGASFFGYASDITCSYPVNGKFTPSQEKIYNSVLHARDVVLENIKPGVSWLHLHQLGCRDLLSSLRNYGVLTGDVEEMYSAGLSEIFQPHGLGHLMGIDVHDVGGYMKTTPPRSELPFCKALRTARTLEPGMVMTVEPGCYFIKPLIERALKDPLLKKFLVMDSILEYKNFGGVRIEDDILVTASGYDLLTDVPRTIQEIELWMSSQTKISIPDIASS